MRVSFCVLLVSLFKNVIEYIFFLYKENEAKCYIGKCFIFVFTIKLYILNRVSYVNMPFISINRLVLLKIKV